MEKKDMTAKLKITESKLHFAETLIKDLVEGCINVSTNVYSGGAALTLGFDYETSAIDARLFFIARGAVVEKIERNELTGVYYFTINNIRNV